MKKIILYVVGILLILIGLGGLGGSILGGLIFILIGGLVVNKGRAIRDTDTAEISGAERSGEKENKSSKKNIKVSFDVKSEKNTKTEGAQNGEIHTENFLEYLGDLDIVKVEGIKKDKILKLKEELINDEKINHLAIKNLLGSGWKWPAFEEWRLEFQNLEYYPYMWDKYNIKVEPQKTEKATKILGKYSELSEKSKKILLNTSAFARTNEYTCSIEEAGRKAGTLKKESKKYLNELKEAEFANYPLGLEKKLHELTLDELKPICEDYDLKKSGLKAEVIKRIVENVPEETLKELLPPETREELCSINVDIDTKSKHRINWEMGKIKLYAHTFNNAYRSLKNYFSYKSKDFDHKLKITMPGEDPCPVCNEKADENIVPDSFGDYPPFHPGCRCITRPDFEF